jgi:predicted nucleic acid-binding protein
VSVATVIEAIRGARRYQFGYFDALIWATAKLNGIPNILSEDGQDGQLTEGVRRLNPLLPSFNVAQLS